MGNISGNEASMTHQNTDGGGCSRPISRSKSHILLSGDETSEYGEGPGYASGGLDSPREEEYSQQNLSTASRKAARGACAQSGTVSRPSLTLF
ncbi:hypothetical protein BKA70DRAFT_1435258 [Coprinopsis sp. MPI-PUGE-AT-0042]|nr:hypothetical protein BKA70DRAFT_1435258 [Coprinopsis sp. MPI-PUGE-AT-0042]